MQETTLKQQLQTAREEMRKRPMSAAGFQEPVNFAEQDDEEEADVEETEQQPMTIRERYLQMQK